MSLTEPRQLANINSLRTYIDSTHNLSIRQKSDLIKDLNRKKEQMIASITSALSACRDSEAALYNRWIGTSNKIAHDHVEEYNKYLKEQHDRGSELISQINAMNNFDQLNKYEVTTIDPYLDSLKTMCTKYSQKVIPEERNEPVQLIQPSPQTVRSVSSIQPMTYSQYQVPVRTQAVQMGPSVQLVPVSPPPAKASLERVMLQSSPVVQATPVRVVQAAPVVQATPVRVVQAAPVVQNIPMTIGQPKQLVVQGQTGKTRVVTVAPVKSGVHKGVIIEDYSSKAPGTLNLTKDTLVTVVKYEGDWALVETNVGQRGYVSRHFIRPIT
jgi:hypothetical protein